MIFKKILVPVDGSEHSKKSLDYAKEIAVKFDSELTVLHVYEIPIQMTGYDYGSELFSNITEDFKNYANNILNDSLKQVKDDLISVNKELLIGNQGMKIVDLAEKNNFDLIIMGSKGISPIKSLLLGSVSNYVIHHTKIPVLLIH